MDSWPFGNARIEPRLRDSPPIVDKGLEREDGISAGDQWSLRFQAAAAVLQSKAARDRHSEKQRARGIDVDMSGDRLTIDTNVARAFLSEEEELHDAAIRLFELAREGAVELGIASTGYNLDVHLEPGELSKQIQAMAEKELVTETVQLPYPGRGLLPGPTAIPGHGFPELHPAWAAVLDSWIGPGKKPCDKDRAHVETHLLTGRDVFITHDRGLLTMCRRLRDEYRLPVEAMAVEEYLERFQRRT